MSSNYNTMFSYAKKLKKKYPNISNKDLEKAPTIKFITKKDITLTKAIFPMSQKFLMNPISLTYSSINSSIYQEKQQLCFIQDNINMEKQIPKPPRIPLTAESIMGPLTIMFRKSLCKKKTKQSEHEILALQS